MKPEAQSKHLLNITKAKAKMWEYDVPYEHHIAIPKPPETLFPISVALLGDVAAEINRGHENTESFKALTSSLPFAAEFFNSFLESRLIETLSPQLRLLASSAFYLCNMPGNAKVITDSLQYNDLPAKTEGLNALLLWILQGDITTQWNSYEGNFSQYIVSLPKNITRFYTDGDSIKIEKQTATLRTQCYETGTDEQLLLGDLIAAVVSRKIRNASIRLLPSYSNIGIANWLPVLQKQSFIREFWPAQRLLGESGVFEGKSAVVQMPTSAGKTKSIELILRSAFMSQRTNLAIIIAPFRALCHEIKAALNTAFNGENVGVDALSDVLQNDVESLISELLWTEPRPQILVVTPEKLLYVLRQHPELATNLKVLIFDEGHQFDTGKRGITYELLITSLKRYIQPDAQKVLISAVIPNATEIAQWLNGDDTVAQGSNLFPTAKAIGFASWSDLLGQIKYTEKAADAFFVPRIIESHTLQLIGRERRQIKFPEKNKGQDIALFLGLKLCGNGGVAIFCGRKGTAINICRRLVDIIRHDFPISNLTQYSNANELAALSDLCAANLGENSIEAQCAKTGILAHHNNIPYGIRIAVEHAMREDKIRIVVCTSTLAQGVNLPIRYLIVTGFYQGKEPIKVRDFHNLIGRAGRAGKHIEGSILFAEPEVYDNKSNPRENWRWRAAQNLLDVSQSEKCVSSLLELFELIHNNPRTHREEQRTISFGEDVQSFEVVINSYINNQMHQMASDISNKFSNTGFDFDTVLSQLFHKQQLLESVENFLLAHWDDVAINHEEQAGELAKKTLAYHLADDERKQQIIKVFQLLAKNISEKVQDTERKKIFGRTLYGIHSSVKIENWVNENRQKLLSITDTKVFFETIWEVFCDVIGLNNPKGIFNKFDPPDARKNLLLAWVAGKSFVKLLGGITQLNVKKIHGTQRREFTVEDMVDICDNTFAFDGMLIVGAVIEFLDAFDEFDECTKERFQFFQKQLKYGLPTVSSVAAYEIGFSDRVLAQKIADLLNNNESGKNDVLTFIRENDIDIVWPSYYGNIYNFLKQGGR